MPVTKPSSPAATVCATASASASRARMRASACRIAGLPRGRIGSRARLPPSLSPKTGGGGRVRGRERSEALMALLEVRNVTKEYRKGEQTITPLRDVSLDVSKGEFVSLMGASGSGKTTLLNLAAGIDRPTTGRIMVNGTDITQLSRSQLAHWRAGHIGYIFQLYNLIPVLTAYENVEMPLLLLPLSRAERRKRVAVALEAVDLCDRAGHYPRQLSGGQEQRVGIA